MTAPALCCPDPSRTVTPRPGPGRAATPRSRSAPMPETHPSGFSLPHVVGLVRAAIPPMHPGGRPIVAGVAAAAGLLRVVTGRGTLPAVLATAAFFRAPRRVPPPLTGRVLAAADGTVATVGEGAPPAELGLPAVPVPRVSVFLSVLDVH